MKVLTAMAVGLVVALGALAQAGAHDRDGGQAGSQAAAQSGGSHAQDDAAIRAVVKGYVDARERNDPAAVAALFTADADQLTSSGEWRRGREALVKGAMASSARTGGSRTITADTIRYVAPGVAVADGPYVISGLQGGATRKMWASFVLVKDGGTWRIAAIRNMLPATGPPATGAPAK
jgi:uncharacterized protein (TIGR02246 family)